MRNSKIIKTLKLLSLKEIKDFKHFVNSPFHNTNKKCIELYNLLLKYAPTEFESKKLDNPDFFKRIYANKEAMNVLRSDFVKLLEAYMIELELKEKEAFRKYLLLEQLRKRGAQKHFNLTYSRSLNKVREKKKNIDRYYEEYLLEFSNLNMLYDYETNGEIRAKYLMKTVRAFEKYIISNHLRLYNTTRNILAIGVSENISDLIENSISNSGKFIEMGNQDCYKNEIIIKLHLLLLKLHQDKKEDNCINLFDALKQNYKFIEKDDYALFYNDINNFYITKIMEGNSHYNNDLFDVYKFAMETGAFLNDKYLGSIRMKNIIIVAVNSGRISAAHEILNKYVDLIEPLYKDAVETYCRGYIYFEEGKYETAGKHLHECVNLNSLFVFNAQTIRYQIYYIENNDWAFENYVDAFIAKLTRDNSRYPKSITESYRNFMMVLKQMYKKKKNPNCKKTKISIKENIDSKKYISAKKWLLTELDKLND